MTCSTISVDNELHPSICGKIKETIKNVMSDTLTSIYIPNPFAFISASVERPNINDPFTHKLFIAGPKNEVPVAKLKIDELIEYAVSDSISWSNRKRI